MGASGRTLPTPARRGARAGHPPRRRLHGAMHDAAAPSRDASPAFTLRQAAAVLGISLNTLRKRIADGQVRAERVERPQGHVWRVYVDGADRSIDPPDDMLHQDGAGT